MRCVPQVHGVVNDTVDFVKGILLTEMNSALDNPVRPLHHHDVMLVVILVSVCVDGAG